MKPKLTVFQEDEINITFWHKETLKPDKRYRFIIMCYGLPSHPYQHNPAKLEKFTDNDFILVYPHYKGTWASGGTMSWEGCVDTVKKVVEFIQSKSGKSAYDLKAHKWNLKDISLIGGSFGGSVALVSGAKIKDIQKIISVAGPTNWRTHSRIPEEASEPIEKLFDSISRGWKNLWRIPSKEEWDRLANGTADLNPIDYIQELKSKSIMLIHGIDDKTVSPKRSEEMYEQVKDSGLSELLILEKQGHLGNDVVGAKDVFQKVLNFLNKDDN